MKKIQYLLLLFVLLSASPIKTFAQPFVQFIAQSTDVSCDSTDPFTIDLDVVDFTEVNSFDFTFEWDPTVVTLTNVNDLGLIPGISINQTNSAAGLVSFSWFSLNPTGNTIANSTLITFTFELAPGVTSNESTNFAFTSSLAFINIAQYGASLNNTQYTLTDGLLNITDIQNPTLSGCPSDMTVDTGGGTTAQVTGADVTAMDNCGVDSIGYVLTGATTGTGSGDVSNNVNFEIGTTQVTYTAYDFESNTSDVCVFNVEVTNTSVPGDLTIYTNNPTVNCESNTVSVNILADNFTDMLGAQFNVLWNTSVLEYVDTSNIIFTTGIAAFGTLDVSSGKLVFSWGNSSPENFPNGTVLFTINFNLNSQAGINLPITFEPGSDEFTTTTSFPFALDPSTYDINNGSIFVFDDEDPTITCVPDVIAISTNGTDAVVNDIEPTTSDNCGIVDTVYTLTDAMTMTNIGGGTGDASGFNFPLGTTIVEYTVTDFDGNTSNCSFNVTVQEPGVITVAIDSTEVSCETTSVIVGFKVKNFIDVTGLAFTIEWDETELEYVGISQDNLVPVGAPGITQVLDGILTYSWNGFASPNTFNDDEDILLIEFNVLNNTIGNIADIVFATGPVAFDISTLASFPFNLPDSQTESINGAVEIIDNTDPVITCPMNVSMNANGADSVMVFGIGATATDNCGTPSITYALSTTPPVTGIGDASGFNFPAGESTTVIYIATDGAGNTDMCSFTVTITQDPLMIECPMDITQDNDTGECNAAVPSQPITILSDILNIQSVTYDVTGATVTSGSGDLPALSYNVGVTTVTYTVNDVFGAEEICSFTVTISDVEAPEFSNVPMDITIECDEPVPNATPAASDQCDGSVTVILTSQTTDPITQAITRTWTASDIAGNENMVSQTISIVDTEVPTITCPTDITVDAFASGPGVCEGIASWTEPTTNDNCDMMLDVTSTHSSGSFFPLGTTEVTYYVEDDAGNIDSCKFNVMVIDNTVPTITCPADITINATATSGGPGDCEGIANWTTPVAMDDCDTDVVVTGSHNSGDSFPLGTTEVTLYAEDAAGNIDSCKFNVIVEDMEAPTIIDCPSDTTIFVGSNCFASVTWDVPTASDNCDPNPMITSNIAPGSNFSAGSTPIIITAEDASGNIATCTFNVIVVDEVDPSIFCPVDVSVSTNGDITDPNQTPFITSVTPVGCDSIMVTFATPASFDNCSVPTLIQTEGTLSGAVFGLGTHLIQFVATDASDNTDTCEVNITITPIIGITAAVDPDSICTSSSAQLSVTGAMSMDAEYTWAGPNGYMAFIQNPEVTNAALIDSGFYVVSVFEPASGCVIVDSVFLAVTEGPDIEVVFSADTIFCTDGTVDVQLTANNIGAILVDSWEWQNPDGLVISMDQNTTLVGPGEDASGIYCVSATSVNGCVTTKCDTLVITSSSSIVTPSIDDDCGGFICVGETCSLFGIFSGGDIDSVVWTASSPNAGLPLDINTNQVDITPTQNGIYTYTFTIYSNGCSAMTSTTMNVSSAANVFEDNYDVPFNGSLLMDVTENDVIPGTLPGIFDINVTSDVNNGTLTNNEDGTFTYTPDEGFFGTDQFVYEVCVQCEVEVCVWTIVTLNVTTEDCLIPTVLTPNGDEFNEVWEITCIADNPENEVVVYNRWGDEVFQAAPYNNDWKGTYNDKDLPDGTYFYIFKTNPNDSDPQKGTLTIMR